MSGFDADLAKLRGGAADFEGFAGRAGRIAADLGAALEALGPCWGDDAVGRSFAEGHVGPAASTRERVDGLNGQFGGLQDRFAATERTYRKVDEGNETAFNAV
ncbi:MULTISPECIES: hypothetical protein [Actinosynnema]|uniref:WXG100 family type VII secretion target n=1 Tax=Actinosynnema TaxID=40566 RepID=UPI0020A36D47|nr:hypothetical protein [Actinosynnema pretiosum]MCP2099622.1 hypothetical protein [Actinosynnema pretiosum]